MPLRPTGVCKSVVQAFKLITNTAKFIKKIALVKARRPHIECSASSSTTARLFAFPTMQFETYRRVSHTLQARVHDLKRCKFLSYEKDRLSFAYCGGDDVSDSRGFSSSGWTLHHEIPATAQCLNYK